MEVSVFSEWHCGHWLGFDPARFGIIMNYLCEDPIE